MDAASAFFGFQKPKSVVASPGRLGKDIVILLRCNR